ncbi:MAG TPA: rod shape-determining protein MreC [Candidatus Limnocylindrales bacterium]|nr:rod shape-determining protein MreC [Candidatus Limnocylindrales bacterium]
MTTILATRHARRRGIAFTVLLAVTLLLMAFSSNPLVLELQRGLSFALRPFQGVLAGAVDGVAGTLGALTEIDRLYDDNAALRQENERLENENARLREIRRENETLTALLQLRNGLDHETVATRVIGRETAEVRRLVVLDKGSDDGIEVGDSVIGEGGALAGRVTDVGPNFAKVTLITDGSSTVIGQLLSSAATGEVVGQLGGVLVMQNIDATVRIALDEEVFTAGLELAGGIRSPFPKGLVIGRVVDVRRDANDVVQTAFLAPAANLDSLEYALVITDYEGGLPPLGQEPIPCGEVPEGEPGASVGTLPEGEAPCYTPTPEPSAGG